MKISAAPTANISPRTSWSRRAARSSGKCFKERGYCFGTAKAVKAFGNAGCLYHDVARVPRNDFERANISAIKEVESSKGC